MRKAFLFSVYMVIAGLSAIAQYVPVPVTGFDEDVIAEAAPSTLATTSAALDAPASNKVMYSEAFRVFAGIGGGGLPDNGTITSGADTYQLAAYTGSNALCLLRNETGTLTLATPASFARLRVLCFSTEANVAPANSLVNISLSFTDGSTVSYITNYGLADWFNSTTNLVLSGFGRCSRVATAPWGHESYPINPRMYYIEITLTCTDIQKQVSQLQFANVTTAGANAPFPNQAYLAVSGLPYSQNIVPTITASDCSGPNGSIALNVTGSSSPYTYSWNTTPVQTGATATGLAPGNYTCTITDASGCATTYNGTVTLNNNAAVTAAASPATICPGANSQLSATVTTGNLTDFTWTPGGLTGQTVSVTPGATTTYTVNASNSLGCTASAQVTVTTNPVPAAPMVNNVTICAGTTATLQVQSPQPGDTYNWYSAATGGTALATGTSYTTPALTLTTTYYVEATNTQGCTSASRNPVTVTVEEVPNLPAMDIPSVCPGSDAIITIVNPPPGHTFYYYSSATGGTPLGSGTSFLTISNVTVPVTYYVEAVTANGCTSNHRAAAVITLLPPLPQPVVSVTNTSFSSITFSWTAIPGATGYQVTTDGGATYQTPSSGTTGTTHTINGLSGNTTVIIQVRALGPQACENSILSAPVPGTTLGSREIFVPNVFTPNGDGRNDVLLVYGNYMASLKWRIFNQWGEMIFISENLSQGWDGTHKGKQQPVGVYTYVLQVVLQDGTIVNKKGAINLIR